MYKIYVCVVCGELYNEEHGDPEAGLPAGTKYEDIPDWWVCPECGSENIEDLGWHKEEQE